MLKRVFNWLEKKEDYVKMIDSGSSFPSLLHISCLPIPFLKNKNDDCINLIRFLNKKGLNDFNKIW